MTCTTCNGSRRIPWPEAGMMQDCPNCNRHMPAAELHKLGRQASKAVDFGARYGLPRLPDISVSAKDNASPVLKRMADHSRDFADHGIRTLPEPMAGPALDHFGKGLELHRNYLESDGEFRARIREAVRQRRWSREHAPEIHANAVLEAIHRVLTEARAAGYFVADDYNAFQREVNITIRF